MPQEFYRRGKDLHSAKTNERITNPDWEANWTGRATEVNAPKEEAKVEIPPGENIRATAKAYVQQGAGKTGFALSQLGKKSENKYEYSKGILPGLRTEHGIGEKQKSLSGIGARLTGVDAQVNERYRPEFEESTTNITKLRADLRQARQSGEDMGNLGQIVDQLQEAISRRSNLSSQRKGEIATKSTNLQAQYDIAKDDLDMAQDNLDTMFELEQMGYGVDREEKLSMFKDLYDRQEDLIDKEEKTKEDSTKKRNAFLKLMGKTEVPEGVEGYNEGDIIDIPKKTKDTGDKNKEEVAFEKQLNKQLDVLAKGGEFSQWGEAYNTLANRYPELDTPLTPEEKELYGEENETQLDLLLNKSKYYPKN